MGVGEEGGSCRLYKEKIPLEGLRERDILLKLENSH